MLALAASACLATLHRRHGIAPLELTQPSSVSVEIPASERREAYTLLVGVTEVTQRHWRDLMGTTPSYIADCDDCPVEMVSWYDAAAYTNALSAREGLDACYALADCTTAALYVRGEGLGNWLHHPSGRSCEVVERIPGCDGYRLPTLDEWNVYGRVLAVEQGQRLGQYAVFGVADMRVGRHPVATRLPNELGLFDTLGNVEEWLDDPGRAPAEASDDRLASAGAWFYVAGTSFTMRRRDVTHDHLHVEAGSWGRDCAGFRVVRTTREPTAD